MEKSKIETYLGFCIRSGKIIFGTEMIERKKKGVHMLVVDGNIGKNSLKIMLQAKETLGCNLYVTSEGTLGEWVHRPAVKAVAIMDKNLASAIETVVDGEPKLKLYSGGNN